MFFIVVNICLISVTSFAQTKDPILRVETGTHNGIIRRIAVDASEKFLVTGAEDKTVRLWDITTGRLLKIFRPPIGAESEGSIYSVAISPDAKKILCSGWTGWDWEQQVYIYIFDRETGVMTNRITGIPNVVHDLKYSSDGKYIGAVSGGGVHIYRSGDFALIGKDEHDTLSMHHCSFYGSSYFVTADDDGYLRLYDLRSLSDHSGSVAELTPAFTRRSPNGQKPFSVAFSPDGSKIAVGYLDVATVEVLSGVGSASPLDLLFLADMTDVEYKNLGDAVEWSQDGKYLYAGGSYSISSLQKHPVRRWSNSGRGSYVDFPLGATTINQVFALRNNSFIAAELASSFGAVDSSGTVLWYDSSSSADCRNDNGFRISYNGSTIQYSYKVFGYDQARFSINQRSLEYPPSTYETERLQPPLTYSRMLNVNNWEGSASPMLDSSVLTLESYEHCNGLAITPDKESFLLGTGYYVRHYDYQGRLLWKEPTQGAAWSVNISGNGKVGVAAAADGTIRWYRMWDGKELLAYFPHADRKRWVLWTPSGYYDVSPGGEDLIGWNVNNGKDSTADFFPVSKFRSVYYRPDIIAKVLETLDEADAVRLANVKSGKTVEEKSIFELFPPVVSIVSPQEHSEVSSTSVTIRYNIRNLSRVPVTAVKALIDGRPAPVQRGVTLGKEKSNESELEVTIPEKDCEVSIIAENQYTASDPATVKFIWRGKHIEGFSLQPNLYVLAIGVSRYQDERLRLGFASKDAQDFAQTMMKQKGILYHDVITKVLADSLATKDAILDGLQWIKQQATREDVAMIFMAGHGVNDQSEHFYFLPADIDVDHMVRSGLDFSQFKGIVSDMASKVVVFIDACHAANILGGRRDINAIVNQLASAENGIIVFSSSTGGQSSLEDARWNNGAFTKALIEGLNGEADKFGEGKITTGMLGVYANYRVGKLTEGKQTPVTIKPSSIPDFPIAGK